MAEPGSALRGVLLLACALAGTTAWAQSAPQSSAAASAAERAQKESDRTMYWIRILADKPAPAKAAAAKPATAPTAAAAAAAKPAADAAQKVKVAAATPAIASTSTGAAPTRSAPLIPLEPAPAPVVGVADPASQAPGGVGSTAATDLAGAAAAPPEPAPEPDPGLIQTKVVKPEFPIFVVSRVRKGNVEVQFEVDPGGVVVDASVVQSSNARLNEAALDAVKQWRFKPGPKSHIAAVNLVFDVDNEK